MAEDPSVPALERRDRRNHHQRERSRSRDRGDRNKENTENRNVRGGKKGSSGNFKYYEVVKAPPDEKLGDVEDDPRGSDPTKRITKKAFGRGSGRNTESFDPASTLVRPDLRVQIGSPSEKTYQKPLKHDDVVIVPELFGKESDWELYYKLVEEMRCAQRSDRDDDAKKKKKNGSDWIPWHEGAHLITKDPTGSPTYNMVRIPSGHPVGRKSFL